MICMINERVSDIDRMVGATLQIRDHIYKDDSCYRMADFVHKTLNMAVYTGCLQIVNVLFKQIRL